MATATKPTNEQILGRLEDIKRDLAAIKKDQQHLASAVAKLTKSPR